jgi:hypothetical protein
MKTAGDILQLNIKPKEKQRMLVEAVVNGEIPANDFVLFFESAPDKDKGSCADAMKHISAKKPALLYRSWIFSYNTLTIPLPG